MHHKQSKARSQTAVWMFMWEGRVERRGQEFTKSQFPALRISFL